MQHIAYGRDVGGITWPDPAVTHGPDYGPYYPGHTGVDASTAYAPYGKRVPLYSMSDGIVVAVATPAEPNSRYLTYARSGVAPAVRAGRKVWAVEHMDECVVSVGQWIRKDQHIGFQGWTGNVDPPGPEGTHSHTKVFDDPEPYDPEKEPQLEDPVPYVTGELAFPPSPKPKEDTMVNIPPIQYLYNNPPAGRLRDAPNGNVIGTVAVGQIVTIDALSAAGGYSWGHTPDGWVAVADTDGTPWVVQIFETTPADTSAMEAQIASLGALVDARDVRIRLQDEQIATQTAKIETARNALA